MTQSAVEERRRYFRLRYPPGDTARITFGSREYELTEISERGVRFRLRNMNLVAIGQAAVAVVQTRSGHKARVEGVVLRIDNAMKEVVLHLIVQGVSAAVMFDEQRYIIKHHPEMLRRRFSRLRYPPKYPARITIGTQTFPLTEVSENGLRFRIAPEAVSTGQAYAANIDLHVGYRLEVKGVIARYENETQQAVMHLTMLGIPSAALLDEERYISRTFTDALHI